MGPIFVKNNIFLWIRIYLWIFFNYVKSSISTVFTFVNWCFFEQHMYHSLLHNSFIIFFIRSFFLCVYVCEKVIFICLKFLKGLILHSGILWRGLFLMLLNSMKKAVKWPLILSKLTSFISYFKRKKKHSMDEVWCLWL